MNSPPMQHLKVVISGLHLRLVIKMETIGFFPAVFY